MTDLPESTQAIPRRKKRRDPLTSLAGLLTEAGRCYRRMKTGKMDHEKGRSLVWVLAQMRAMVEAQELERINAKLEELSSYAEHRYGHQIPDRQARLPH